MAKSALKKTSDINIDLLKAPDSKGRGGEAVHWLLNVGRYLIIITEIVALAIFILSIKLSVDKNSLKEEISNLSGQVSAQETFENEFRNTSKRFSEVKNLLGNHFESNKILAEFLGLLPKGMTLSSFRLGGDQLSSEEIEFSGEFSDPKQLQTLVVSFSKSNKLVALDIKELNHPNEDNPRYTFTANALVNKLGFTKEQ